METTKKYKIDTLGYLWIVILEIIIKFITRVKKKC